MKVQSDWRSQAVCASDSNPTAWLSYDILDVEYAKRGCANCNVKLECFLSAWENDLYVGVNAGISEFDYLNLTWKEAEKVNGSNWSRGNKTLQRILQKIK